MELDGLKRCLRDLEDNGITVESLTTDRHPQIESYMRKNVHSISHYFDTWHVVKGTVLLSSSLLVFALIMFHCSSLLLGFPLKKKILVIQPKQLKHVFALFHFFIVLKALVIVIQGS